jgi:hypothetical protein
MPAIQAAMKICVAFGTAVAAADAAGKLMDSLALEAAEFWIRHVS